MRGWGKWLTVMVGIAIVVAAGVGALLIARGSDEERATSTTAPPQPGTDVPVVLQSGGLDRRYVVHVPGSYDGSHAVPLVLVLHASGSNAMSAAQPG